MMDSYAPAFGGKTTVRDYYERAVVDLEKKLNDLSDEKVLANSATDLTDALASGSVLEKVVEVESQPYEAIQEGDFSIVRIALKPAASNRLVTQLCGSVEWPAYSGIEEAASYGHNQQTIMLRVETRRVGQYLGFIQQSITSLNRDIEKLTPEFIERANFLGQKRMWTAKERIADFDKTMSELGIRIVKRAGAVEPVNVEVKREVRILREPSVAKAGPSDEGINPESLQQILRLVDQAGKGFEVAPATFTMLGEEDLRNIIVGYLNAVFANKAATGETFSKRGKADIVLNVPNGGVLIFECKYWSGAKHYVDGMEQLFGYLTYRHGVAVMVAFSRNKEGLTQVLGEVDRAIAESGSYKGRLAKPRSSYRISEPTHPADPEKTIEVHHLFFDLHT